MRLPICYYCDIYCGNSWRVYKTTNYLKNEFKVKNLYKTKFCLDLQVDHFPNGIFVHQSIYTKEVLKYFHMNKTYPLSIPIIDWSLDVKKDHFRPQEEDAEILGPEVPYISAIDTLMYFVNCTWTYKSNAQLMGNTNAWYLSDLYQWRSETEYHSLVTILILHEDLSSEQRRRNSWNKHISPKIILYT